MDLLNHGRVPDEGVSMKPSERFQRGQTVVPCVQLDYSPPSHAVLFNIYTFLSFSIIGWLMIHYPNPGVCFWSNCFFKVKSLPTMTKIVISFCNSLEQGGRKRGRVRGGRGSESKPIQLFLQAVMQQTDPWARRYEALGSVCGTSVCSECEPAHIQGGLTEAVWFRHRSGLVLNIKSARFITFLYLYIFFNRQISPGHLYSVDP